jgi:hypothetical protein
MMHNVNFNLINQNASGTASNGGGGAQAVVERRAKVDVDQLGEDPRATQLHDRREEHWREQVLRVEDRRRACGAGRDTRDS